MRKEVLDEVRCVKFVMRNRNMRLPLDTARKTIVYVHRTVGYLETYVSVCAAGLNFRGTPGFHPAFPPRTIIFRVITDARLGKYFVPLQPVADSVEEINILSYRVVREIYLARFA